MSANELIDAFPPIPLRTPMPTRIRQHYTVVCACASMPSSCWGKYRRVGLLAAPHGAEGPTQIRNNVKRGHRIVRLWERLYHGTTSACAYQVALEEAQERCDHLNRREAALAKRRALASLRRATAHGNAMADVYASTGAL